MKRSFLPEGSKVSEASVLRRFADNISHAAHLGTRAAEPYRRAYHDALKRADEADRAARMDRDFGNDE